MIENAILSHLLTNEEYTRRVVPYLKSEYFDHPSGRIVFETFLSYFEKYNDIPSSDAILVLLSNRRDLGETSHKEAVEHYKTLVPDEKTNQEWLLHETEKFCKDQDLYLTMRKCIAIIDGGDKTLDVGAIPKMVQDSLSINFDTRVGHNYLNDAEDRFEYYNREESRLPFDIEYFNLITQGGLPPKSLTCFIGGTGTGKSIVMCHMAAAHFAYGKNVLYVTLELAEEEISRRIDANLLNVPVNEVKDMNRDVFLRKISRIREKTKGTLTVKEYPAGSINANHIRFVIEELRVKQGIEVDVIYLDYINLCNSFRVKNTSANSYTIVKAVAEEVRGLAMEYGIPIVTATQPNKEGMKSSEIDLTDVSESVGLPYTLDAFFSLNTSEELESLNQIMVKQLKNRWGDINFHKKFLIGMDKSKMRLYNLDNQAQQNIKQEAMSSATKEVTFKTKKKLTNAGDIT